MNDHRRPGPPPDRPARPDRRSLRARGRAPEAQPSVVWIYGLHAVAAALADPRREIRRLVATRNALARLQELGGTIRVPADEMLPKELDQLVGADAVHQGVAIEAAPLEPLALDSLEAARLIVILDQVTDPHNVGAVLRSAAALGADGVVTTFRHQPGESGVLAKAASGALDLVPFVHVGNLAQALTQLRDFGFTLIGLDSDGTETLERAIGGERIGLVLGAEGKGLRHLTRERCDVVARIDMPGPIKSLNVSNAAVLALYLARKHLDGRG